MVVGAKPQPPYIWISSPGKGLFHHPARGVAGKCLPDQSLGMAPVKAPRTRQFRGTGWPSEGQKRSLCPTGTRRARFPAGPLGCERKPCGSSAAP
jgi:hypothetical protein